MSDVRKVLYSPGYGGGWTTWGGDTKEQKLFMLEYQPFIEAIESGGSAEDVWSRFQADWSKRFPGAALPYSGGIGQLEVWVVPAGTQVHIDEYDGYESVVTVDDQEEWL